MSRPRRIPARGDVRAAAVADLLGLSLSDFEERGPALRDQGFPEPDPTTGLDVVNASGAGLFSDRRGRGGCGHQRCDGAGAALWHSGRWGAERIAKKSGEKLRLSVDNPSKRGARGL